MLEPDRRSRSIDGVVAAVIPPFEPYEGGVGFPMQAARKTRFLVHHSCRISHELEIRANRAAATYERCHTLSCLFQGVPETNGTDFWYRSAILGESADRKCLILKLAAPQGFEPRYADPESAVLPLNEGAVVKRVVGRNSRPISFYDAQAARSMFRARGRIALRPNRST
jgi:hypothetical protein